MSRQHHWCHYYCCRTVSAELRAADNIDRTTTFRQTQRWTRLVEHSLIELTSDEAKIKLTATRLLVGG
jgi:hypothetical protein